MMTFYKLYDYETNQDIYLNPNAIKYYVYNDTRVEIYLLDGYMLADKLDFMKMLFLDGGK